VRGEDGPETESGPLALRRYRSADHLFCILHTAACCQTASAKKRISKVLRLTCLGITREIRTTPTGHHPLDLVMQGVGRSAAHRLCG